MKKMILAVVIGTLAGGAYALPNGKPFQELAAQVNDLQQEVAALEEAMEAGDAELRNEIAAIAEKLYLLGQLQNQIDSLRTDVDLNAGEIGQLSDDIYSLQTDVDADINTLALALETTDAAVKTVAENLSQEVANRIEADEDAEERLAVLAQMVATGECGDGAYVTSVSEDGTINCASPVIAGTGYDYQNLTQHTPVFTLQPSSGRNLSITCPAGTAYIDGGYNMNGNNGGAIALVTTNAPAFTPIAQENGNQEMVLDSSVYQRRVYWFANGFDVTATQAVNLFAICKVLPAADIQAPDEGEDNGDGSGGSGSGGGGLTGER
ncbi:hypothetical protein [Parahaliea aestuarii]|uniref:Uncharacterized protein n=1 Tax=Parahaliea aestuarii TaxID=1852021 RepID=A0A5C8ZVP9_9GAMM|nr:hypothetical protein [Parahaliea aestuarii]TXS91640.1 hypothetical protein FVW59_10765 [Parahaliea aestuarii]